MKRHDVAGGWYVAALPAGQYAILVPGKHIETHQGNVPLPFGGDNVLFLDITPTNIAGQSHSGQGNVEWSGEWTVKAASYGTNPVIYDNAGVLHHGAPQFGAQGFRFVDENNRIWTGDETYADHNLRLGEWTRLGDVTVGQSGYNLAILYKGERRVVARGVGPQNIKFKRTGEWCVVSWYDVQPSVAAHVRWFHTSEIASEFPLEAAVVESPPPPPVPKPEVPKVEPQKLPARVQTIVETLYERNLKLAHSQHDDDRRVLARMIAEQVRFELGDEWGWKSNHGVGVAPAKDAIAKRLGPVRLNERQPLLIWDLFNGSTRKPNLFPLSQPEGESNQFFIPVDGVNHLAVESKPTPVPEPTLPNPGSTLLDLGPVLAPLKAEIATLKVRLNDATSRIQQLEAELDQPRAEVKLPRKVALKTVHGKYVCAEPDGRIVGDRDVRLSFEAFDFEVVE
jgi:hypothetical protein